MLAVTALLVMRLAYATSNQEVSEFSDSIPGLGLSVFFLQDGFKNSP